VNKDNNRFLQISQVTEEERKKKLDEAKKAAEVFGKKIKREKNQHSLLPY
jgi:hypothetical protein